MFFFRQISQLKTSIRVSVFFFLFLFQICVDVKGGFQQTGRQADKTDIRHESEYRGSPLSVFHEFLSLTYDRGARLCSIAVVLSSRRGYHVFSQVRRQHRTVRIFNLLVSRVQIRDCHMFVVVKTKQNTTKTQNIRCYGTWNVGIIGVHFLLSACLSAGQAQ